MIDILWSLPLTLLVFFATRKLAIKLKLPLLNPLLMSMVVIIPLLLVTNIPYARYFAGSKILNESAATCRGGTGFPAV
ncbi:putative effector of murein hydrolase [Ewingella americana]